MSYNAALNHLQSSILHGDPAEAASLVRPKPHLSAEKQLGVYLEGYRLRLVQAVRNDYPCLGHYLGATRMNDLVAAYVEATPSCSYNLDFYPFGFGAFVRQASQDPAAHDLAVLEQAIAEIFMAPDSNPLTAAVFAQLDPETLGSMVFYPRAANRLLRLTHDVERYLAAWKKGEPELTIAPDRIHLCVLRHNNEVQRHRLEPEEYHLLENLAAGQVFGQAIEPPQANHPQDSDLFAAKVMNWLPRWVGEGFFKQSM
ncbi:MAG: putative DNA-binding domain-containing protein [Alphaproteobacteria bacterium]|nr:putative DNA-binding domain-containing protein [Alphaproteobacteria bacterium]